MQKELARSTTLIIYILTLILFASQTMARPDQGLKEGHVIAWTKGLPTWPSWLVSFNARGACQRIADVGSRQVSSVKYITAVSAECTFTDGGTDIVDQFCYDGQNWEEEYCPLVDDSLVMCAKPETEMPTIGNPIVISDGIKIQQSIDWKSPKDDRFSFERFYRSDIIMGGSPVTESHSMAWGSKWDIQLAPQDTNEMLVYRENGSRYLFSGTGLMAPYRSGHNYELLDNDPIKGGLRRVTDGSGRQEFYSHEGVSLNKLEEIHWPDGYVIKITRDAEGRISQISDTRGQVALPTTQAEKLAG